jgi:hypothetical protein
MATLDDFRTDGFVVLRGAVAPGVVQACLQVIESELRSRGVDLEDRNTWTEPVVRFVCPEGPAFAAAGTSAPLWETYDQLLGPDRWIRRQGVGGTIPVRFPSTKDPGDAGWHIDGSYRVGTEFWVNVNSRQRGLLALFLFTEVGEEDAPTEIIVGSHLEVPRVLAPHRAEGMFSGAVAERLPPSVFNRPRAFATGRAGDVYLCHPFLVHRATWPHRGNTPRILAQPEIGIHEPFALQSGRDVCAVERAILDGLEQQAGAQHGYPDERRTTRNRS